MYGAIMDKIFFMFSCAFSSRCIYAGSWGSPAMTGDVPPPCSDLTLTAVDSRRAVLFGGCNGEQGHMNDTFIIDFVTMV